jgi:hypothetical protein
MAPPHKLKAFFAAVHGSMNCRNNALLRYLIQVGNNVLVRDFTQVFSNRFNENISYLLRDFIQVFNNQF